MDREHLARIRVATTLLQVAGPPPAPTAVVDQLVAVQAQEFVLARWSLGQRAGVDDATVRALLDAGDLVRTHVLRPTWHLVRPGDLRWLQELTGPRVRLQLRGYLARAGLDGDVPARFCAAAADALAGGRALTRDELAAAAAEAGVVTDRFGLSLLVMHAELENVVCSGPVAVPAGARAGGRHHTYALVDDRVPVARPRGRAEALAELTLRYFRGHGPATEKDFAWWSSLTLADIREGLRAVGDGLERAVVEGRTYWGPPGWTGLAAPPADAHLLQTFDEFVVGYGESRDVLDVAGAATMWGPRWGRDGSPVVVDGQVVAHWRRPAPPGGRTRDRGGAAALPVVAPCRELTSDERSWITRATGRLAAFLDT